MISTPSSPETSASSRRASTSASSTPSATCSDVGRIVFVNEVTSVECDVFPGAPGGDDASLDAFTQANVAQIVAEIHRL